LATGFQDRPSSGIRATDTEHYNSIDDFVKMGRPFEEPTEVATLTVRFVFGEQPVRHRNEPRIERLHFSWDWPVARKHLQFRRHHRIANITERRQQLRYLFGIDAKIREQNPGRIESERLKSVASQFQGIFTEME